MDDNAEKTEKLASGYRNIDAKTLKNMKTGRPVGLVGRWI